MDLSDQGRLIAGRERRLSCIVIFQFWPRICLVLMFKLIGMLIFRVIIMYTHFDIVPLR